MSKLVKIVSSISLAASVFMTACAGEYNSCRIGLDTLKKIVETVEVKAMQNGEQAAEIILNFEKQQTPPSVAERVCLENGINAETNYTLIFNQQMNAFIVVPKNYQHENENVLHRM